MKNNIIKYKEIIFGVDTPICTEYLNVLLKQQVINEKAYIKKLSEYTVMKLAWDNIVVNGEIMMGKGTGEALGLKADYTCYKEKFEVNFTVFIEIKCCKVERLYALDGIDALDI